MLKWNNISSRDHIQTVMGIGNMIQLQDKDFEKLKDNNSFLDVTKEELEQFYKD